MKLVQIKEFFRLTVWKIPVVLRSYDNTIVNNGDDGKHDEDHTESSASFKEAFKVEKEKEAENLRKMKEEKLDLAIRAAKAISDEDFLYQLVSIKNKA